MSNPEVSKRRWDPVSLRAQGCGCLLAQYEHYRELGKSKPGLYLFKGDVQIVKNSAVELMATRLQMPKVECSEIR